MVAGEYVRKGFAVGASALIASAMVLPGVDDRAKLDYLIADDTIVDGFEKEKLPQKYCGGALDLVPDADTREYDRKARIKCVWAVASEVPPERDCAIMLNRAHVRMKGKELSKLLMHFAEEHDAVDYCRGWFVFKTGDTSVKITGI